MNTGARFLSGMIVSLVVLFFISIGFLNLPVDSNLVMVFLFVSIVIGILFLVALYFVFQAGSGAAIQNTGPVASSATSAASGMVGGC